MELFPRGIEPYLFGGLLIGLGVAGIYLTTGLVAGASGVFSSTLTWLSPKGIARPLRASRDWRLVFSLGLVLGAALYTFGMGGEPWATELPAWRLAVGGFLVGLGTRISRGCTSGHGICGLSSRSPSSLGAVLTFMAVAMVTAWATRAAGLLP